MVTVLELEEMHKSSARTSFASGGVMSKIDEILKAKWVRGYIVTFTLEEVYPKKDVRVVPFMVDLIISNYGGEKGAWDVVNENDVFMFRAKEPPAAT